MKRTITLIIALLLIAAPATAAEGVACTDYEVGTIPHDTEPLGVSVVGHFLWLQHTDEPDSLNNIVSFDLDPYTDGDIITVCTDGIRQGEVISDWQPDTQGEQTTISGKHIIYSTDTPHPQVAEEWVRVENGWLIK